MPSPNLKGMTALVTGASSGIGAACARLLAAWGADLVITARRAENLDALARELMAAHGTRVLTIPLDLADPVAPRRLYERTEGAGMQIDVLINNAGFGIHQDFVKIPWEQTARQIQLNVVSLTELTHLFVRAMLERGRGWVLNVSSIGAYMPVPGFATYAAGKAYVRDFTEALAYELRRSPVRVCALCPGGTETEFQLVAGQHVGPLARATFISAERCARIGLRALFAGRTNVVSGLINKLAVLLLRVMPRRMTIWSAALVMGEPRRPA